MNFLTKFKYRNEIELAEKMNSELAGKILVGKPCGPIKIVSVVTQEYAGLFANEVVIMLKYKEFSISANDWAGYTDCGNLDSFNIDAKNKTYSLPEKYEILDYDKGVTKLKRKCKCEIGTSPNIKSISTPINVSDEFEFCLNESGLEWELKETGQESKKYDVEGIEYIIHFDKFCGYRFYHSACINCNTCLSGVEDLRKLIDKHLDEVCSQKKVKEICGVK